MSQNSSTSPAPQQASASGVWRNRQIAYLATSALVPDPRNPRRHPRSQIRIIAKSIESFGFNTPILISKTHRIIAGHGRHEAAKLLEMSEVPVLILDHLTETEARAYMLADNKLTDRSTWDEPKLAVELKELLDLDLDFDVDAIGFEAPEIDLRIQSLDNVDAETADEFEVSSDPPVTRIGDFWSLGDHRILCGNALDEQSYRPLLGDQKASAVFTDPPYNVPINGHVRGKGKVRHREFDMASGEMSRPEFDQFLSGFFKWLIAYTTSSALIYACMDWRHMTSILAAGERNNLDLLNLCVWVKTNGGMGSFYRSRHELVFVFRNGKSGHVNNVQLGKFGRNRTNVWNYPGANSFARGRKADAFESHPTVKPIRLVSDALLDCTHRGDIVLDPFIGSGTTVLAAERTGRRCFGIELDTVHVDTAIRRWESLTGQEARNQDGQNIAEAKLARAIKL